MANEKTVTQKEVEISTRTQKPEVPPIAPSKSKDEILEDIEKDTLKYFWQTKNCAMTSFAVLSEQFHLLSEHDAILNALTAFPGIAGRTETCGACSGSLLALGLVFGREGFEQARSFCKSFEQENGSTQCGSILEANLGRTYKFPEDIAAYMQDGGGLVCVGVTRNATRIAGEIIIDHQNKM